MAKDVVDVDTLRREEERGLEVAQRELEVLVRRTVDHEGLLAVGQRLEDADGLLGLGSLEAELVDDDEATLLEEERERALQRADADLARRTVRPVTRTRGVRLTAAHVVGGAERALACAAGALLLVQLLRRTGDRRTLLRGGSSLPLRRELRLHHFVEELLFDFCSEHFVGERERANLLALHVEHIDRRHGSPLLTT